MSLMELGWQVKEKVDTAGLSEQSTTGRRTSAADTDKSKPVSGLSFKMAFCAAYHCPPERYESKVFWRCLYLHSLPLALVGYVFFPSLFAQDRQLISAVADLSEMRELMAEADSFASENRMNRSILRHTLYLRISGRKLVKLAAAVFRDKGDTRSW
jgi:hypothetical protein